MPRETIVGRFYGSEVEYGWRGSNRPSLSGKPPEGVAAIGAFLENGGRLYVDLGQHPEYATPECKTLDDLVKHELVGERLVWSVYGNDFDSIHKRCIIPDGTEMYGSHTLGAHENYATSVDIWDCAEDVKAANIAGLSSHLATRTAFIGAGHTTREGYVLGQKMQEVFTNSENKTTGRSKPLVNTRDEPHNGGENIGIHRLHVISGDANISPWAVRMKFGTTSLALRLMEHGVDLHDLALADPVQAARLVAGDITGMSTPLDLANSGRRFTALDIQEEYANRAQVLSEHIELPDDEQQIIETWFATVDTLRAYTNNGQTRPLLGQMDWYTKREILDRVKEKRKPEKQKEYFIDLAYELKYDEIIDGIGTKLRKSRYAPYMPEETAIQEGFTKPPEGRAKMRGALIKKGVAFQRIHSETEYSIDWGVFKRHQYMQLPLHGDYTDEEIDRRLKKVFGTFSG